MRRAFTGLSALALLAGCNTSSPRFKDTSNLT
ncbi:lipoprotein, partial [Aureimonas sp. AU4]